MKTLANLVLETLCFFTFSNQDDVDADTLATWIAPMWEELKNATPAEQAALVEAARERLEYLNTTDERGFAPKSRVSREEFAALEAMMSDPDYFERR
jgi:hypothetical protein